MRSVPAVMLLLASCGGPSATPHASEPAEPVQAQVIAQPTAHPVDPPPTHDGPLAEPPPVEPPAIDGP